ncbi:ribonuclease R [Roseibacillus persicicus]|uniref:ribonuclease R n=1 Tax=Roseibacillus persicicus TaxID=454148 RepID=UPI0028107C0C|nr:ribonuclease R [Roseibacillus persicicus]MDQ8188690.1 ribonuclease R [Roseibacillus persicicus]
MKQGILELLAKPGARPLTKSEMARELGLAPKERAEFRRLLAAMVADGSLRPGKKARIEVSKSDGKGGKGLLIGRIRIFPKGHGTVYPDSNEEANEQSGFDLNAIKRIYVPGGKTGTAMDGDTVEVKVVLKRGREGEIDPHGTVTRIVDRTDRLVVGVYFSRKGFAYIQPDSEALPQTLEVEPGSEAKDGQKVAVELIEWKKGQDPRGRVKEIIGWPDSPGVDIMSVVHKYGLQTHFPDDVIREAERVAVEVPDSEKARREDWTDRLVITIDPFDAKDHDDAIWVQRKKGGGWTLAVHIADVSHYVKPGTPLDKEALKRGNSTYLVDRVLPMLPENLSNGICSLRPDEVRLTKCAIMEFNTEGLMTKSTFVDAFINSQAKLSYEDAQVVLDGGSVPDRFTGKLKKELESMIPEAWKLATVLRKRRFKRGALDMEMDEIKVLIDEETKAATGFKKVEHCESHQLIEECMLAANESVAKALRDRQKPAIYRIHDDPDPEKLMEYGELARVHGYQVGDLTNRAHVQSLLDQAKGTPEEHNIKLGLLRSLKRAEYSEEPLGHYGLAKADYAHFTSPIRRYADLIVHRALQDLLKNRPEKPDRTMRQKDCKEAAIHISETERNSSFAEQETKTLKLLEWLEMTRVSDDPPTFEGVVTEVRSMGLFVEATDIMQKGLVKFEDLPGRGWRFNGGGPSFVQKDQTLQTGVKVSLKVAKVDFVEQRVDFEIAEIVPGQDIQPRTGNTKKSSGGRGQSSSRGRGSKSSSGSKKSSSKKPAKKASKGGRRKK